MTVYSDNAARFASTDRAAHADQLLTGAVREAVAMIRDARRTGDPWLQHDAAVVMSTAGRKAERILGGSS